MRTIETTIEITSSHELRLKLPNDIQLGRHKVVLIIDEQSQIETDPTIDLMQLAGQIKSFQTISDPVAWQQQQRNEWERFK
jgi:biotin-(acetyl-CoA carboxylase) ligase